MVADGAPQVRCRVFGDAQWRGVLKTWMLAMLAMSAAIAIGVPAPLAVLALVGGVAVGLHRLAGTATYTLEPDGVRRQWTPFTGGSAREEFRRFSELRRWKLDHSMSRGFSRYEYLELDAPQGPRWVITSRQDAEGFARFREAFTARVETFAAADGEVRRARSFYDTWYGKAISLGLAGGVAALGIAAALGAVALTGIIKLAIFLVPGALYLLWRSFGPRGDSPMARRTHGR
ncbi:MAG TPA: hypothetical protein PK788_06015 [Gemmatimonadaceae bacterium]|nr:hypothetical protein [Gemmatimonadaceae bacterium]HRQ77358.1 hypothetical protein [Gemmatimonadaceae bacterium]